MAKRGNDVYAWRVKNRLRGLDVIPNITWFNPKNRSKSAKTGAIFVTLTYRRDMRVDQAWRLIGKDYNRFICALRRRYGRLKGDPQGSGVYAFRCWEAHKDGYPHIHAVIYFEDHQFEAFHYGDAWRIQEKRDIEELWPFGFSDIEALGSLRGGLKYVAKYLNKLNYSLGQDEGCRKVKGEGLAGLIDRASDLTMSLVWATSRRAWSVSRGFIDLTLPCITQTGQVDLEGEPLYTWVLVGFWGGDLGSWSVDIGLREYQTMKNSSTWTDKLVS